MVNKAHCLGVYVYSFLLDFLPPGLPPDLLLQSHISLPSTLQVRLFENTKKMLEMMDNLSVLSRSMFHVPCTKPSLGSLHKYVQLPINKNEMCTRSSCVTPPKHIPIRSHTRITTVLGVLC